MLLRGSIAGLAFALSALGTAPGARADEAYVCDAGRVVYVKPGELEAMKRTDACIARYFGIEISTPPAQPTISKSETVAPAASAPAVKLKTLDEFSSDARASGKAANVKFAEAHSVIPHSAPVAAPGTDFRNVRLINAVPGEDGWYRHTQ